MRVIFTNDKERAFPFKPEDMDEVNEVVYVVSSAFGTLKLHMLSLLGLLEESGNVKVV